MTTPTNDAPATSSTRPPDRFAQEVREQGYIDEADVTESAIVRGLRRARLVRPRPRREPGARFGTCRDRSSRSAWEM